MSLSLIVGSSGSGKSTSIYSRIIKEAMANKDKNYLVIVPEQYTMSTQRLLVAMHPNKCIMNIDVLSFNRLAYRVFEELGAEVHSVLDDTGKSLVIRKLVNSHLEEITTLRRNITRVSYITQVKSLISEMTQYNISPDRLKDMINSPTMSESFKRKATDLLVIYEAFLDFIQGKYVTTESILSTLNSMLDSSEIVTNSTVVLDGFTGFTPIQYELVEHMLRICDEVAVTITADEETPLFKLQSEDELFAMSCEFATKMNKIAKMAKVEINEPVYISDDNGWLSQNETLKHFERNIFRNKMNIFGGEKAEDTIFMTSLKNPRDELKYVAITINRLVRQGMRYKDIAVVAPNMESYRYLLPGIWSDYNIPYFIDAKTEILFHPLSEAIDALFDIFDRDFRREDVFRFLRSGLTDLTNDEIDYLENYVYACGIKGKRKYLHPFAIRSNSYCEDEDLIRVNEIRNKFINPFEQFEASIKKEASVRDIATALYNFLQSFNVEEKINLRRDYFEEQSNAVKAKEYNQIYPVIMDILDKMVSILGDEIIDLKEFHDIYSAGLSSASIGVIPPANDSVILGDIERTRLSNIKVLFCIGASDDAIPKKIENGGILSQLEREQLLEQGFELAPSDRQKSFRQRFYLYLMLTKPNQRLYLTMPRVGGDGKSVNPSYLVELISKMFPGVKLKEIENFTTEDRLLSKRGAINYLVDLINKCAVSGIEELDSTEQKLLQDLIAWAKDEDSVDLDSLLSAAFFEHQKETVSDDIMLAINETFNEDETVSGSVSKFEQYNECAYKYFLNYVMRLKEREEFELSSFDMGNFYHKAIQLYSENLKADEKKWREVTKDEQEQYIGAAISQTFETMPKVATLEDSTQKYIVETMKDTLRHTVNIITTQVSRGSFEPELFEQKIKAEIIDDESNEKVAEMKGTVDRIDLTDSDDRAVRIIDYKSSEHKLDLSECYYGLSLQLPLYMRVVLDKLKERYPSVAVHPSAMLYYEMANDFVDKDNGTHATEEDILRLHKMSGILSSEEDDLLANDSTVEPGGGSSVVPYAKTNKDEINKRSTNAVDLDGMETIIEYSMHMAAETAKHIIGGEFDCAPARHGTFDACRYCGFMSICHFNENEDGYEARNLHKLSSNDEAIEKMKETLDSEGVE